MTGRLLCHLCSGLLLWAGLAPLPAAAARQPLQLGEGDRLLVLAPHPDDDILAAGGLIQEALALDLPVRVCFFSMGDNNEIAFLFTRGHPAAMPGATRSQGERRYNEAVAAASHVGLSTNELVFLGYPDYGALEIWNRHWRTVPPFRSMLTRANAVPYAQALTPGSAHAGEDILDDLAEVLRDFRPTHVVLPHPADHNVDHRAWYLFTRVALWNVAADGLAPVLLAAPVHFTQWPGTWRPLLARPSVPPRFLDNTGDWQEYALAPFQATNKQAALRRHHSQYLVANPYLDAFLRKTELFGAWPDLALPRGMGAVSIPEEDTTQFRPDPDLFEELSRQSEQWQAIAEQNAAETARVGNRDNDFTERTVSGDGQHLTLAFQFLHPIAAEAELILFLYGYRPDIPFGEMPKITLTARPGKLLAVKDLDAPLEAGAIELVPDGDDEITLRVPLNLLGDAEKILTGAKLMAGRLPVDWVPWRVIDLVGEPLTAPETPPAVEPPPAPEEEVAAPPPAGKPPAPPANEHAAPLAAPLPPTAPAKVSEAEEPVYW